MAAILKSKMVVSGDDNCKIIFFITMCIRQFQCNFCYVGLSSFYLKVAKKTSKLCWTFSPNGIHWDFEYMIPDTLVVCACGWATGCTICGVKRGSPTMWVRSVHAYSVVALELDRHHLLRCEWGSCEHLCLKVNTDNSRHIAKVLHTCNRPT